VDRIDGGIRLLAFEHIRQAPKVDGFRRQVETPSRFMDPVGVYVRVRDVSGKRSMLRSIGAPIDRVS
jgi:hypothetical protein